MVLIAPSQLLVAVEDVLQIEAGDRGHEERDRLRAMDQPVDAIGAGLMLAIRFVIANDGGQVTDLESVVCHQKSPGNADGLVVR